MNKDEFRKNAHQIVDWIADYWENIEDLPVKSQVEPFEIYKQLPATAPESGESFEAIMTDFQQIILKGMTHWQHPAFMAYFPANSSAPSVLAEMLTAAMGAQGMIWQTSPAVAELEQRMMEWLADLCHLPPDWHGVIQDTASTATLCAILTARERKTHFTINTQGFENQSFTVYCSTETHSSIDKAVRIAGLGSNHLQKIAVDDRFAMIPANLEKRIIEDLQNGKTPLCVVASIGTTSSTAVDPLREIAEICTKYGIWLHVDAAFSGSAAILPEKRWILEGLEKADSYVFNPHKWLFTNFDCTAYYVKDKESLLKTFEILPEYLKTPLDKIVNNYRDWGVQLGRRFRSLKLWFVMRSFGAEGLRSKIREHLRLADIFKQKLEADKRFEILAPVEFNLVCFRYLPENQTDTEKINLANEQLLGKLNATGKVYLTHTKLKGIYTIRAVFGQTNVSEKQVELLWNLLNEFCVGTFFKN